MKLWPFSKLMESKFITTAENNEIKYYPVSYQQDNLGIYREYLKYDDKGKISGFLFKSQSDCVSFCTIWMDNIKEQQNL